MRGIAGFYGKTDARLELSPGQEPIANEDGRLQIVFCGEVYDCAALRDELVRCGHAFRTEAGAEVMLHAYEEYGAECFTRFNGAWAVAIADTANGRMVLSRDHLGIKPLYYAETPDRTLFAWDIKSLLQDPAVNHEPNDQMVYDYLAEGLLDHTAETFFRGIRRLPAAHYAVVDASGVGLHKYWEPKLGMTGEASPEKFRELLRRSVKRRLTAGDPVGASLSGGLHSSAIVSLMSELARAESPDAGKVKTFSAVFDNDPLDEREGIADEAKLAGVDNLTVKPASDKFVTELEDLIWRQEEPMSSTAPYAQWDVMRLAGQHVKVLFDGQGGDELFGADLPYHLVYLRQLLKQHRYGQYLRESRAAREVVRPFIRSQRRDAANRPSTAAMLRSEFVASVKKPEHTRIQDNLKQRLLQDLQSNSLPARLRYESKNAAAFSLETRTPFLDKELVEWALSLPDEALIHDGWSRSVVRDGLAGIVPDKTRLDHKKTGFATPELRWLKARRAVLQSIVNSPAFQSRKYWNGKVVADELKAALAGHRSWTPFFWRAINLELWLRVFFEGADRKPGHDRAYTYAGDARAAELAGTPAAAELLATACPNPGKSLFMTVDGAIFSRVPVKSKLVEAGDDIIGVVRDALAGRARSGDVIAISEKIVAISQGRSFPIDSIKPSKMARFLAHFVRKTPSGIGLGIPETMELAIREVGLMRILIACGVTAVTRVFGLRGLFYRIVGPQAAAIDGPTPGTIPPYNTHAKLAPKDPDQVARKIAAALGEGIRVAIIDANDLGVNILGHTPDVDPELVGKLFIDNPLGQGHQQTPIALLRKVSA